ncbi:Aryl-alcohol dehydrogenase [Talaromyces pinophilus]|nr:Aryl-alcohol dehydrogenase [Talaromyces pinophilus]
MSRETTALVLRKVSGPFTLETIKIDVLKPHEALIEIHAVGLCHTDLPCATGVLPAVTPAVFGHEGAGAVVENGSRVDEASVSDKTSAYCDSMMPLNFGGLRDDGTSGLALNDGSPLRAHFFSQSSFSRLAVVHRNCIVKTGAGSILNTLNVQEGSTVAIFGVRSVGLSAIMAARIRKAKEIIAIDIQPSRLELAKQLGAISTVNSTEVDALQEIRKICPPSGVDYALDCSGVLKVIETMVDSLAPCSCACSASAPTPGKRASVDVFSRLVMGKEYVGCHQGGSIAKEMIPNMIDQHNKGQYPLEKLMVIMISMTLSV